MIICVAVVETTVAVTPLNFAVAPDKFPELAFTVTFVPTGPEVGKTLAIVGGIQATIPCTLKSSTTHLSLLVSFDHVILKRQLGVEGNPDTEIVE